MSKLKVDIKRNGVESAYVFASNFYKGKEALEKEGFRVISLQENAALRMLEGEDSSISKKGNWVRESLIYVSREEFYITKNSPAITNKSCDLQTPEQVKKSFENSIRLPGEIETLLGRGYPEPLTISTKEFGDEPVTNFLFAHYARRHGRFLEKARGYELVIKLPKVYSDTPLPYFSQIYLGEVDKLESSGHVEFYYGHVPRGGIHFNCDYHDLSPGTIRGIKGNIEDLKVPEAKKQLQTADIIGGKNE